MIKNLPSNLLILLLICVGSAAFAENDDYIPSVYSDDMVAVKIIRHDGVAVGCAATNPAAEPLIVVSVLINRNVLTVPLLYFSVKSDKNHADVSIEYEGSMKQTVRGVVVGPNVSFSFDKDQMGRIAHSGITMNDKKIDGPRVSMPYNKARLCREREVGL